MDAFSSSSFHFSPEDDFPNSLVPQALSPLQRRAEEEEHSFFLTDREASELQLDLLLSLPNFSDPAFVFAAAAVPAPAPVHVAPAPAPAPAPLPAAVPVMGEQEGDGGNDHDEGEESGNHHDHNHADNADNGDHDATNNDVATDDPTVLVLPFVLESGRTVLLPKEKLDLKWKPFTVFFGRFRPTAGDVARVKHCRRRYQLRKSSTKGRQEQRQRQRELEAQVAAAASMTEAMLARVEGVVGPLLGNYLPPAEVAAMLQAVRAGLAAPPHHAC